MYEVRTLHFAYIIYILHTSYIVLRIYAGIYTDTSLLFISLKIINYHLKNA